MNKLFLFIFTMVFTMLGGKAFAAPGVNFADHMQVLNLQAAASITGNGNGTGVDLKDYAGQIAVVLDAGNTAGTTPTLDVKIQDSADNSSFADVTSGAFTQVTTVASVQKMVLNKDQLRRYIRVVKTIGGTSSPAYVLSVKGYAIKKYPQ